MSVKFILTCGYIAFAKQVSVMKPDRNFVTGPDRQDI